MTDRTTCRRALLGGGLAAMATGTALAAAGRADAAPASDPWLAGGNTGITTDGTNYLGTRNVAPLVLKTAATDGSPLERMRITPTGRVGIGTATPQAALHARAVNGTTVRGQNNGVNGTGVHGQHLAATGTAPGVLGETGSTSNGAAGVVGRVNPTNPGASSGVWGINSGTGPSGVGVYGTHAGAGYGVLGSSVGGTGVFASGGTTGVYGSGDEYGVRGVGETGVFGSGDLGVVGEGSDEGVYGRGEWGLTGEGVGVDGVGVYAQGSFLAADLNGDVAVAGTLSKSAGSFRIDHPLDPERKWLSHSFVESPDMMNVYNGNTTTDADGRATVELPTYFEALNRDFRYQLTVIGTFAQAIVERKIADRRFVIATDKPRVEVSWQVTGIRQDTYAREHPIVVEQDKTAQSRQGAGALPPSLRQEGTR